jgi:DNA polymerase-3 subunit delta
MARGKICLYLGPELGEKDDALAKIKEGLGAACETTSFYAGETPVQTIADAIRNGSLFAENRLFIIKNAENISKKNDIHLMTSCLESAPPGTNVVLQSDETHLDKALEGISGAEKRVFFEMFENRKQDWVAQFFRRAGFSIKPDAVAAVLELVENNTEALRRECGALTLFLDKNRPVEAADVEKWLSHSREEDAFTLFGRLAKGDLEAAIETCHSLLAGGEAAFAILPGLLWCVRRLRDYCLLMAASSGGQSQNLDAELRKIGLGSPLARKNYEAAYAHMRNGKTTPQAAAQHAVTLIAQYDFLVRSLGTGLQSVLMDTLLCKLAKCL